MVDDLSNYNYLNAGWDFRDGQVVSLWNVNDKATSIAFT
jgi:hypothetical protein